MYFYSLVDVQVHHILKIIKCVLDSHVPMNRKLVKSIVNTSDLIEIITVYFVCSVSAKDPGYNRCFDTNHEYTDVIVAFRNTFSLV